MTHHKIISNLITSGWKEFKSHKTQCTAFYKSFQNRNECLCNEGKKKQAEIYIHEFDGHCSVNIEVAGEIADERWININLYGLKLTDDASYYENQTNEALDTWDFASRKI
jgi:hypothetical protein